MLTTTTGPATVLELLPIPATAIHDMWGEIAGQMEVLAEISHGRLLASDIFLAVRNRDMQLWAARDDHGELSLMLTEILNHPRQRDAHIISATGQNADRWVALWPKFEEWARAEKCVVITARCRSGWKKLLAPIGFHEAEIILEKRLT